MKKRLAAAAASSIAGLVLLIAGTAVTLGPGPALVVAGVVLMAFGLLMVGVK